MQTLKTSKAKENILSRVRKALSDDRVPMPFPEADKEPLSGIYAKSGLHVEEEFADAFTKLGGKFVYCETEQELLENILRLYENRGWKQMFCSENRILSLLENHKMHIATATDITDESADACITGCDLLVARTGSVLLSSRQNLGRTSPVFYPVHIIVAYTNQLVPDIEDGLNKLRKNYGDQLPSMINLNTGPSRTADIEKTLVVGVHGPGEVFCFYVNK